MEAVGNSDKGLKARELLAGNVDIALVKRRIMGGQETAVPVGSALFGHLTGEIKVGDPVILGGGTTSPVLNIAINDSNGRVSISTRTSEYEVLDKRFNGLDLDVPSGSAHLPIDAQPAKLDDAIVDLTLHQEVLHINKPELSKFLIETHGAQVFRAADYRFMVLAKVGNIHLPFYVSQNGSGGKRQGEWYPFFGHSGSWLIKRHIEEGGDMNYHPKVEEVRRRLNRHLVLPQNLSRDGRLGSLTGSVTTEPTDTDVVFDINEHLGYKRTPVWGGSIETEFVNNMTGYNPVKGMTRAYESYTPWINAVVSSIK